MTINEWLTKTFKHITLYRDIMKDGTILHVPEINVDLTTGIISTSNKEEFGKLVFAYLPAGTVIEPIDQDWYDTKVLQVRNMLTKKLLTDPKAKIYLDILARRDRDHWMEDKGKTTTVNASSNGINLEFTVVDK